jgi:F-type H+-transporting ATPase subunit epsilon
VSTFLLEIVTPERKVYEQEVHMVVVRGAEGELGILPNHIPLVTPLLIGPLKIERDGVNEFIAVSGGFMEVRKNKVVVLAESAELPQEIDLERAVAARERAERRLHTKRDDIDHRRAELALQRALNRMNVAKNKH